MISVRRFYRRKFCRNYHCIEKTVHHLLYRHWSMGTCKQYEAIMPVIDGQAAAIPENTSYTDQAITNRYKFPKRPLSNMLEYGGPILGQDDDISCSESIEGGNRVCKRVNYTPSNHDIIRYLSNETRQDPYLFYPRPSY